MEDRHVLHVLIDELPEGEIVTARRFLEYLRFRTHDPLRVLLDEAPSDDEPLSEEEQEAVREGFVEKARGEVVSQEEVEHISFAGPREAASRVEGGAGEGRGQSE